MCHGEYDDPCRNCAVDDGEGKALEKHPPGIRRGRRPSKRKGQCADSCFLYGGSEASPKASLFLVVVDDLGEELTACSWYKPG
jgi:hypothetical protein